MNVDKRKTQVEVLAPAGSLDIMKAVVAAGADAIYLGGNMFGARAFANNFNDEELICAIEYAHLFGRKVYLTVNTLLKSREIENSLIEYLIPFYEAGLDAVIVQDMGVFNLIRKHFPDMDIHASTQMTQTGVYGSRLLKELGATRIVTSREMNLQEIKQLHERLDVEIESFVHGALCYCYSGQCLLSSFNGGRSGNRGRCAQPCRMPYDVYDNGEKINNRNNSYALSPKDMCALQILPDVIESGVYSLKIEGRMKNVTYAAMVTHIYRKYVDMYLERGRKGFKVDKKDIDDLSDIYNRGAFTTGYYDSVKGKKMMSLGRPNHMGTECLKVVSNKAGRITFKALKNVNRGDVFEIDKEHSFESGADVAAGQTLVVNLPKKYPLYEGRIVNRMNNAKIKAYVADNYVGITPKLHVDMRLVVRKNENISLTVMYDGIEKTCTGEIVTGQVIEVNKDEIILSIAGNKSEGVITRDEYSNDNSVDLTTKVQVGEEMEAKVIKLNDGVGMVSLSYKRMAADRGNKRLEEAFENQEVLTAKVAQVLDGGLSVEVEGSRVFIPASLVSDTYEKDLSKYAGQEIQFVITEFNPKRRRIIGDRKQLLVTEKAKLKEELFSKIQVGDKVEGTVKNITDFGAFIDLGGADGLLHISEMSWGRVENPKKVFKSGDKVTVLIKDIQGEKIALSLKFPEANPWAHAAEKYAAGSVVTGRVARMTDFGAFVELEPGVDALLHVSQISREHIEKPADVLKIGQEIEAKVVDFNGEDKKISLSMKALEAPAEEATEE